MMNYRLRMAYINGMKQLIILFIICMCFGCGNRSSKTHDIIDTEPTILSPAEEKFRVAQVHYEENPDDPDALIWYGRHAGYIGNFQEAIEIYTTGMKKHPNDARVWRHRGHRYISIREFEKAIDDLETAVSMIQGKSDEVEPDGLPNDRNIPIGTLHSNIWYHLGLAYYLQNDLPNACRAYNNRTVLEKYDDNLVSGGHWLYMILRRMEQEDQAIEMIKGVHSNMDIIENHSYYKMCLFYKELMEESELQPKESNSSSDDVLDYGLANWHLYHNQDTTRAKQYLEHLFENGNKYSFAYIAAETDWNRLFGSR